MKILLFGGSGMLGAELIKTDPEIIAPSRTDIDITSDKLKSYIENISPDIIINAAAETDNRKIEKVPSGAIKTNIIGAANVAEICRELGIRYVYISTDYCYKGDRGNYKETDEILPFNLYAWTKLGGECSAVAVKNHLIIRTSFGKNTFDYPEAFSDKWVSKDYVDVIAPMIYEAAISPITGVLNIGTDRKTIYEYAKQRSPNVKPVKIEERSFITPYDNSFNLQKWTNYKNKKSIAKTHNECRVCGSSTLTKYLDLGLMPLANNLEFTAIRAKEVEKFPLQVLFCEECGLSQLSVVIDPEKMFSYYTYRSSVNAGYVKHCKEMAVQLKNKLNLTKESFMIDIACFPEGSFVNTRDGYIDISKIKKGEMVLSHDDKYHKILKVHQRNYNRNFIKIKIKSLNSNITMTPEHPVFTKRGWIKASDIKINDLINIRSGVYKSTDTHIDLYEMAKKCHPHDIIIVGDKIVSKSNGNKSELPRYVKIDKEFSKIIGYYIGEGDGSSGNSIRFSFHHSSENEKINEIEKYFKSVFNLDSNIYIRKSSKMIRIHSRILSSIFRFMCGDSAYKKKIPHFIYRENIIPVFIKSLWFTDGHLSVRSNRNGRKIKHNTYIYSSVSKNLILDLRNILESIGIITSLQCVRNDRGFSKSNGTIYRLTIQRNSSVSIFESLLDNKDVYFIHNDRFCEVLSIKKIKKQKGLVFNIEVEDANSYVCDGVTVHNCNDGALMAEFRDEIGLNVLGIDPATNLVAICEARGIESIADFLSQELANKMICKYQMADLITATNVFAHVDNVKDFILSAKILLKPNGVLVLEFPYLVDFIEGFEYDTVYFEHLSYFSVLPISRLCGITGMKIVSVEKQNIHGGTVRVTISKEDSNIEIEESVRTFENNELKLDYDKISKYTKWATLVRDSISEFSMNVMELKKKGYKIAAFAASAKGNTLLNSASMNTDIINYIADETPEKIGKFSPLTGIPIVNKQMLVKDPPDYLIILSWNFKDEIMEKLNKIYKGKYIIPIPKFTIQ